MREGPQVQARGVRALAQARLLRPDPQGDETRWYQESGCGGQPGLGQGGGGSEQGRSGEGPRRDRQSPEAECRHLSWVRVSMACRRTEVERESSGSSWICLWTGTTEGPVRTSGRCRPPRPTPPLLKGAGAATLQPGQGPPPAGSREPAHCSNYPETSVQGHPKHPSPHLLHPT